MAALWQPLMIDCETRGFMVNVSQGKEAGKVLVRGGLAARRRVAGTNKRIVESYISNVEVKKLQIGCGDNCLEGWLNADLHPNSPDVLGLDATKEFPLEDACIDRIFSEHMIEHVPYSGGQAMLAECYRVLKPGGKIRLVTPDVNFLIDLYVGPRDDLQERYVAWACKTFCPEIDEPSPLILINSFVRSWGHTFIYDEPLLKGCLERAGFSEVEVTPISQSSDEAFVGLEHVDRMPDGFLELESMVLEGVK